jgi:hypothetical protein
VHVVLTIVWEEVTIVGRPRSFETLLAFYRCHVFVYSAVNKLYFMSTSFLKYLEDIFQEFEAKGGKREGKVHTCRNEDMICFEPRSILE